MPTFNARHDYQRTILDRLRRTYGKRYAEKNIPVPDEHLLRQEAAVRWANELDFHEVQKCLLHFHELNDAEQDAVLAAAHCTVGDLHALYSADARDAWKDPASPPDDETLVIVCTDDGAVEGGYPLAGLWYWASGGLIAETVTGWQDWPEPRKS